MGARRKLGLSWYHQDLGRFNIRFDRKEINIFHLDAKNEEEEMKTNARKKKEAESLNEDGTVKEEARYGRKRTGGTLLETIDLTTKKGFSRGLVPERIIGAATVMDRATDDIAKSVAKGEELVFLIKWCHYWKVLSF